MVWWWKETHVSMPHVSDGFRRDLAAFDPALAVRWDIKQGRFIIVERRRGREHHVITVADEFGRYCPCDQRAIRRLVAIDGSRFGHGRSIDYLRHVDEQQRAERAKQDQADRQDVSDMVRADRRFINGAAVVTVPGASDVRK